ncbi:MAG: histidine kinase [Flavobacteriaceae bacterium]|nr:histidine kinase [Flavobacteriaceae bacterium]
MEQTLIFITSITLFILVVIFLVIVNTYAKKKSELILRNELEKQRFEQAIVEAQLEIQEQILKNIGSELHDNLGQLLSIANIQLNILEESVEDQTQLNQILEANNLVEKSINEIRTISKTFNTDYLANNSLSEIIQVEVDRFKRLRFIDASFEIIGEEEFINKKDQIIIFRILQEFINNSLKHAEAKALAIILNFDKDQLNLTIKDNGKGFDINAVDRNSGLYNMESRAKLINAAFELSSVIGEGTTLTLLYNLN